MKNINNKDYEIKYTTPSRNAFRYAVIDNFLQNLSQQIESFPNNQEGGEIVDNLSESSPQPVRPGFEKIYRPFITPRGGYRQDFSRTTQDLSNYQMDTGFSLEKGLNFLFGR